MNPTSSQDRAALIRERLAPLAPSQLEISDESHLHAGHAGAQGGAGHYRVLIVSEAFAGLTPVARHRLVYHHLHDLIPFPIHALALDTRAP
ncbi:BolA family protein [Bordetella hinzii]|jgi:BolA protein|uniref:BolA family transcriptional regulator n=1 Tax=Bordetella hinzii TaxID=103855 RepID=A0AAN1VGD7_9BORD|nr:BolA family protein [Bordetella hinzii]AZW17894.1 BolA family transcriptional regulator [Bordetella hinzii]MBZ0075873.1 BolA family transcriptional regulator [Bordetella hinzii]MBZ0080851.1 BolA family transcriptional regulator [Bordetella hinzii]MBZ0085256.1 BolA family transcriptional regulator [Bordetella hinzii]QDJ33391.1 BolA family transcriptional regulator [Bordetella hinzii]